MTRNAGDASRFPAKAVQVGFKAGHNGPHISRTMMLAEFSCCLDALAPESAREDYRAAIVTRNLLGKQTEATRRESFRRLRELYALDPLVPLFRLYRELDARNTASRPLLAVLLAAARDPLLRATIPLVSGARDGDTLGWEAFDEALDQAMPGFLKPAVRAATARHIASTWTQSGHLRGRRPASPDRRPSGTKTRQRVAPSPVALMMALMLGALQDIHGVALFATDWCRILDLNAEQAYRLAQQAHREGLLDLRAAGTVVEIRFPPRFASILTAGDPDESR